jgi:hypothetical protein
LVDACKDYINSSLPSSSGRWLWAAFCISHAFDFAELMQITILHLVSRDVWNDSTSTPLASALALFTARPLPPTRAAVAQVVKTGSAIAAAAEDAAAEETVEEAAETKTVTGVGADVLLNLFRRGLAEDGDLHAQCIPEVMLVVIIMRLDQLAAGRPLVQACGTYLNLDGEMSTSSKRRRTEDNSTSNREIDVHDWPEVPDELLVSLLQHVNWSSLQEAELIALSNQRASYSHQTPAVSYLASCLLDSMSAVLLLPRESVKQVTGWVDFPPLAEGAPVDPCTYKLKDLRLLTTTESISKAGFHLELRGPPNNGKSFTYLVLVREVDDAFLGDSFCVLPILLE